MASAGRNVAFAAAVLAAVGALVACDDAARSPDPPQDGAPQRIVSLDYCADQYVLKFADRDRILAVSPDAVKDFSYMKGAAVGVPTVRPTAENVLILKPDLVVRSYGGGPNATEFFERAGVPVLNVGWASDIDGADAASIPLIIKNMAEGLGAPMRGAAVIADYRRRLAALDAGRQNQTALYMTPTGVTTGPGSLVHEMLTAAGYENFETAPGWRPVPLERLVYEKPDVIAGAFFDTRTNFSDAWAVSRHPLAREAINGGRFVALKGAWTSCGGWFAIEAIEALANANREERQ